MKLITNWKQVLTGAWSMRLVMIAAVISALGVFLSMVLPGQLGWDPIWFAAFASVINVLAIPARVIMQGSLQRLSDFRSDESGALRRRGAVAGASAALVIALATPFIAKWEGVRLEAYKDVVGVETICFGDTHGVQAGDTGPSLRCLRRQQCAVSTFCTISRMRRSGH
ncbi:MAG: hypothetical protein COB16_14310 [Rhodobacteraceae bacterium]|nr:MAG: hypothetical protein COB16_14310 [Paracoccaceae bacterium]